MNPRARSRLLALSAATALLLAAAPSPSLSGEPMAGVSASRLLSPPPPLHGITVLLAPEGRVVVGTCTYEGGIAVAGAQVTVFAPGGEVPHLTTITDPAGLFAFLPGAPGEWRVVVDDGVGHRREAAIKVDAGGIPQGRAQPEGEGAPAAAEGGAHDHGDHVHEAEGGDALVHSPPAGDANRPWQLATGLSLILGLSGFAYGFRARRTAP